MGSLLAVTYRFTGGLSISEHLYSIILCAQTIPQLNPENREFNAASFILIANIVPSRSESFPTLHLLYNF